MEIKTNYIPHNFRNKYLKNTGGYASSSSSNVSTGNGLPYVLDENGNYVVEKQVLFKKSIISKEEVVAYGEDNIDYTGVYAPLNHPHTIDDVTGLKEILDNVGSGGTASIQVVDNLQSTSSTAALSAKQGKILSDLIADKAVTWDTLQNKPSTFTPSAHSHAISGVTGLQGQLDSKASSAHTHSIANISNLQTELNGKASANHTHAISGVTGLQAELNKKSNTGHTHDDRYYTESEVNSLLSGKTNNGHTHTIANVTGLQGQLDSKASSSHTHSISSITNLQSELNSKASSSHTHTIANVTNLQAELNKKSDTAHTHDNRYYTETEVNNLLAAKASSSHTHSIANITGLQGQLDSKASSAHTHSIANITNLEIELNNKSNVNHTHVISAITGLQTQLDSKVNTSSISTLSVKNSDTVDNLHASSFMRSDTDTTCTGNITVGGNLVANGEITAYSDRRLKTDIRSLSDRGLLNPVTYIKDNKRQIGFIAQDVQKVYPELVSEDTNGYLSLNYQQLTAVLSSQINNLYSLIDELKLEISRLKNK